jgi:(2Fe-2S) ferredoxin
LTGEIGSVACRADFLPHVGGMSATDQESQNLFSKMDLASAQRHAFLCVGPNCCATVDGIETWETLKRRIAELGAPALRTKAACLRLCRGGPWLLVYPEGVWYGAVTPERCERIVKEHLVEGRVVREWASAEHPLS